MWDFLYKLSYSPVDESVRRYWPERVGPIDQAIAELARDGLLRPADDTEKLTHRFTIPQLRSHLAAAGIQARGKKADLVSALVRSLPPVKLRSLVDDYEYYKLTDAGRAEMDSFYARGRAERETAEASALRLLLQGDAPAAYALWLSYVRSAEGSTEAGAPNELPDMVQYFYQESLYTDLDHTPDERNHIRAGVTLAIMVGRMGEDASRFVLPYTGGDFRCKSLAEFLSSDECEGFAKSHDQDSPDLLLSLYVHTKYSTFTRAAELSRLTSSQEIDGIEILPAGDCGICEKGKLVYEREELASLQKLPRHWGCRCFYIPWLR